MLTYRLSSGQLRLRPQVAAAYPRLPIIILWHADAITLILLSLRARYATSLAFRRASIG